MKHFYNPVRIYFGRGGLNNLPEVLGRRTCAVVTTAGAVRRGLVDHLKSLCGDRILDIYTGVEPNPTIASTISASQKLNDVSAEVVVAIGGGSVLDTAKGIAAQRHPGLPTNWLSLHLRDGQIIPTPFLPLPIIAIPTTAGTGSEVTMWATIWDDETGKKYSLTHPSLYPEVAIVDPELTLSLPEELTATTALDALSHAMEAIWNKNANPVSDALAVRAISIISSKLKEVLASPTEISIREALHYASLMAGLAFSNTCTAIAHSISYPLTSQLGIPHGLACSFTIPEILKVNGEGTGDRVELIIRALGCKTLYGAVAFLNKLFVSVNLSLYFQYYVNDQSLLDILEADFIDLGRAENNIVNITQDQARGILKQSLARTISK